MMGVITMNKEEILNKLESTANFMRGMCFDPRLHPEIKEAIRNRVSEIERFIEDVISADNP